LQRRCLQVGAQERLSREFALWIANEHPADRDRGNGRQAGVIPHGGLRDDLDDALRLAVPPGNRERHPRGGGIIAPVLQRGQPFTDQTRTTDLMGCAWGWRGAEVGVQAQPRNEGSGRAHRCEQLEGGIAAISHDDELAVGQVRGERGGSTVAPTP